jgi:hypothetical protein
LKFEINHLVLGSFLLFLLVNPKVCVYKCNSCSIHSVVIDICSIFIHKVGDLDRVNSQQCRLHSLEVDAHELLSSLLLEDGSCVRKGFLDDSRLDVHEIFMQDWPADETEILGSGDENLEQRKLARIRRQSSDSYLVQFQLITIARLPVTFNENDIARCYLKLFSAQLHHREHSSDFICFQLLVDSLDGIRVLFCTPKVL